MNARQVSMGPLDQLLVLLQHAAEQGVPDMEQALSLCRQAMDTARATDQEVLEALVPGTRVRDAQGDVWTKTKDGRWKYRDNQTTARLDSAGIIHVWGPVQVLPWEGPK